MNQGSSLLQVLAVVRLALSATLLAASSGCNNLREVQLHPAVWQWPFGEVAAAGEQATRVGLVVGEQNRLAVLLNLGRGEGPGRWQLAALSAGRLVWCKPVSTDPGSPNVWSTPDGWVVLDYEGPVRRLRQYDQKAGAVQWTRELARGPEGRSWSSLTVGRGVALVDWGSKAGRGLAAFRTADGAPLWERQHLSSGLLAFGPGTGVITLHQQDPAGFEAVDLWTGQPRAKTERLGEAPAGSAACLTMVDDDLVWYDGSRLVVAERSAADPAARVLAEDDRLVPNSGGTGGRPSLLHRSGSMLDAVLPSRQVLLRVNPKTWAVERETSLGGACDTSRMGWSTSLLVSVSSDPNNTSRAVLNAWNLATGALACTWPVPATAHSALAPSVAVGGEYCYLATDRGILAIGLPDVAVNDAAPAGDRNDVPPVEQPTGPAQ